MTSIKRRVSLWLLLLSCCTIWTSLKAQTPFNVPKVVQPSPAVANFNRYGEIPVDLSTGVPSISVPIYTAKSRQLTIPVSLSYHASGIKVNDRASVAGLGWVLNAGGYIGVTRMGDGGEKPSIYNILAFHDATEFETKRAAAYAAQPAPHQLPLGPSGYYGSPLFQFGEVINNWKSGDLWDGYQSNKYNFQLPNGKSGTFRYDFKTGELFVLPYSKIKIERGNITLPAGTIRLTDEDGTIYDYGVPGGNPSGATVRNWDLTRVISADKTDTIRLVYKTQPNIYYTINYSSSMEYGKYYIYNNGWGSQNKFDESAIAQATSITTTYESILDSIVTPDTFMKFWAAGDRADVGYGTNIYRITDIDVRNRRTGDLIKKYTLNNSTYFGTGAARRLKLSGIAVKGSDGSAAVENYSFTYNESVTLPAITGDEWPRRFHDDYWGYYNGNSSESNIPAQFVPAVLNEATTYPSPAYRNSYTVTDRTPNHSYAAACMLQEIKYPTGGKTVFTFEPNRAQLGYWYSTQPPEGDIVGGFRIKNIKNYTDDATLAETKTYEYLPGDTRKIEMDLYLATYRVLSTGGEGGGIYYIDNNRHLINSEPFLPLTAENGPPVFYQTVTEYIGTGTTNTGKTVYTYIAPPAMPTAKFTTPRDIPLYRSANEMDRGNYIPRLDNKIAYKNVGGSYIPVHKTQNTYENRLSNKIFFTGMHVTLTTLYEPSSAWALDYKFCSVAADGNGGWTPICTQDGVTEEYPKYYYFTDLYATQETPMLTQTAEYTYADDGVNYVTSTTSYEYANAVTSAGFVHLQPTKKTVTSSTGDNFISTYKYPHEVGSAPYTTLVSSNILYPVIEESAYKNTVDGSHFLQSVKTDYSYWDAGQATSSATSQIYPTTLSSKKMGSSSYEPRIEYVSYTNKGNIASVRKTTGPPQSYLYDKAKINPVAQVTNATINNIFYESFEDGVGNSARDDSKTGRYSSANGFSKDLTGLNAGAYTLSYWSKPGTTWMLNVVPVTVSGSTYSIYLTGQLDDIRFHPSQAQMVTYTHDTGIGQTSVTDARHNITYYTYDNFSRLKTIRDKDKQILKAFCYNYKGQATDCSVPETAPPAVIYARIEWSNPVPPNPPGGSETDYWINDIATLNVKLYANAACTVPYTLTSDMVVRIKDNYTILRDRLGDYIYGSDSYNDYTIYSGNSSRVIGTRTRQAQHHLFEIDAYWNHYYYYDYELVPKSGSNYTILTPSYL